MGDKILIQWMQHFNTCDSIRANIFKYYSRHVSSRVRSDKQQTRFKNVLLLRIDTRQHIDLWRRFCYATSLPQTTLPIVYYGHFLGHSTNVKNFNGGGPPPSDKRSKFRFPSVLLSSSIVVVGIVMYTLYDIKTRYTNLLPPNADLLPLRKTGEYVYISDPLAEAGAWQSLLFPWLPQISDPSYTIAWRLVQDGKSEDVAKSRNAVAMLSQMTLDESQCHQIAQIVDYRTSVGLAHSNADPRLVGISRFINFSHPTTNLCDRFREILSSLPKNSIHPCVIDWSTEAFLLYSPTEQELESLNTEFVTGFESEHLLSCSVKHRRKPTEQEFLMPIMKAVLSYSRVMETIPLLLKFNIVDLLMTVVEKHRCSQDIMYLVVKIIANLTCDSSISTFLKDTGCIRLLAEFSESTDLKLSLPARRALHNLDREYNTPILTSGIYQLYPDFRFDEDQLDIDIVFIHGLLGGAFRTWRCEDKEPIFRVNVKPDKPPTKIRSWLNGFTPSNKNLSEAQADKGSTVEKDLSKKKYKPMTRFWKNGEWHYNEGLNDLDEGTKSSGTSQCWPRDWLPKDVKNARILAVDFDSFVTHWAKVCPIESIGRTLFDRSCELLEKLTFAGIGDRPIVWVTHSMGGLLLKHLLTLSTNSQQESVQAVADKTRAVMFCSVPHYGSLIHSNVALNTAGSLLLMPTQEVKELKLGSEELRQLNEQFKRLRAERKYKVINFGETKQTVSSIGVKLQLVPLPSADPGFGDFFPLDTDHLNICKVRSRRAFVYRKLIELVENTRTKTADYDDGEDPINPGNS